MLNNYISQISPSIKSSTKKESNVFNSIEESQQNTVSPKPISINSEPSINTNDIEIVYNQTNFEFNQNGILIGQLNFDSILSYISTKKNNIISNLIIKKYLEDDFIVYDYNESPIMGETDFLIRLVNLIETTENARKSNNEKVHLLLFKLQLYLLKLLNSIKYQAQSLSHELQHYINNLTHKIQLYIYSRIQNINNINVKIENIFNQCKEIIDVAYEKIEKQNSTTSQYKGGSSFYKDLISNKSEEDDESIDYLYSADSNNREDNDDDIISEKKTSDVLININSDDVNNIFNNL